jgi:chloramphenicol O-acetyltransferase type A
MREIELAAWPRRKHYDIYRSWDYPHFNMCANVDVSLFHQAAKQRGISFTIAIMYLISRVANAIPEFRYRIRGETVVEHEIVHPSTTYITEGDLFSFCTVDYSENFDEFSARAAEKIAVLKECPTIDTDPYRDDLLFMTPIPWISFTSFMHPIDLSPVDSVPRFAWGKFFQDCETLMMPLSVQGHHALMDGIHMGRYYAEFQNYLNDPACIFGTK